MLSTHALIDSSKIYTSGMSLQPSLPAEHVVIPSQRESRVVVKLSQSRDRHARLYPTSFSGNHVNPSVTTTNCDGRLRHGYSSSADQPII